MSVPAAPTAYDLAAIPRSLREHPQWVLWRFEERQGKKTKVPYRATNPKARAESTNPETWATFEEAQKAFKAGHGDGVGFVFSADDSYFGVDIDGCIDAETGEVTDQAAEIVRRLHSYTELSPSGTGLHIIGKGSLEGLSGRRKGNVEMYDRGRYFTVTGHVYGAPRAPSPCQRELDVIHEMFVARERPKAPERTQAAPSAVGIDDPALLEKMFASKHGAAIQALWGGDTSAHAAADNDGASEADLALASHLAWWCDYDLARADALFRQSSRMRDKWDADRGGQSYGQMTLERAFGGKGPGDGYSPEAGRSAVGNESAPSDEIIVNRQIKEVVREVSAKLRSLEHEGHPHIYSRGDGLLVEMHSGFELREVTKPDSLKALLHDHLEPVSEKTLQNGEISKTPAVFSNNHTALLTRKTAEFPPIKAVSDIPLMLKDGTILLEPGYQREHGYYLNTAGIEVQLIPPDEARALYLETFNEMSYGAPKAGFTATLAFILQPFLMPMIDDLTPLYAVLGSRRAGSGTGKGFLLDCVYRIHRGRPYTHDGSMPATDEEMGKVLFSALSEGVSHIIFDDIDHLKHRQLMAAITSRTYKGRILGVSQRHEVSTGVTWAVSGNAPDIHRDFYRRIVPIYMGIGQARAWERPYSRPDLNRYILENRNLFVSAALSILEHWRVLGMPLSTGVIRGFDRWSAVMGGVLESIGLPHLLEARNGLDELIEVDNSDLDLLIDAWRESSLADKPLRGRDILNLAKDRELFTELHDGRSDAAGAGELGKYLKPYVNDVFGGYYLRRAFDSHAKTWSYYLEPIPDAPKQLLEVFDFSLVETPAQHPRNTPAKQPNTADGTAAGVMRGSRDEVLRDEKVEWEEL